MVSAGEVRVNGQIVTAPGVHIDPENDVIEFDGKRVLLDVEKVYILLNKLPGYLSTTFDSHGGQTVLDLLPPQDKRIYPIGRLDKDTEGLLLLTNDGELTHLLTHPRHYVNKIYLAWVTGDPDEKSLDKLRRGIMLEDGMTAPALVEKEKCDDGSCLKINIHEGRKRQVKRMCAAIGHNVERLKRIQVGPIHLGDLPPGHYRYLLPEEVKVLKEQGGEGKALSIECS